MEVPVSLRASELVALLDIRKKNKNVYFFAYPPNRDVPPRGGGGICWPFPPPYDDRMAAPVGKI